MSTDWIKMSERKPTEADLPVWWCKDGRHVALIHPSLSLLPDLSRTQGVWKCAKADIPAPPREETQGDADQISLMKWRDKDQWAFSPTAAWHAALAHERAEILKLISNPSHRDSYLEAAVRARCTPAK